MKKMKEDKYSVYKHTAPNGKVYIGITCIDTRVRWNNGNGYRQNPYFWNAIKKYGWDNFSHEILFTGLSKEKACIKEIELIASYKSNQFKFGYNRDNGGVAAGRFTDETKMKISKKLKGKNSPTYSIPRPLDVRRRIGEKQKGKIIPKEQREKISRTLKGHIPPNRKPVVCIETGNVFESATAAMKIHNISCMYKALHDSTKTAGGYHWKYYADKLFEQEYCTKENV